MDTAETIEKKKDLAHSWVRRCLSIIWRLAILLLAVWLLKMTLKSSGADILKDLRQANHGFLILAFLAYGVIQMLAAWRWGLLMRVQQMHLPFFEAFKLTMVGNFFSMLIPGAVSGDLLKIAYAGQYFIGKKTEILLTIMLDRILGLFAMFFAAFLATIFYLKFLPDLWQNHRLLGLAVLAVNAGCLGCILAYFLYRRKAFFLRSKGLRGSLDFVYRHLPKVIIRILDRLQAAFRLYQNQQQVLGKHFFYSILVHLINAFCLFAIGKSLGEKAMSVSQYTLSTQIANATGLLPLTPGGLGMRDAVTAAFFKAFHADPAEISGSIPVVFSIVVVSWALLGALVFIFSPALRKFKSAVP
ncbi:MAG: lysylphosphatidylglycerol synthase transmembrane domain-containing protein [Lentisphaeria bacterium]